MLEDRRRKMVALKKCNCRDAEMHSRDDGVFVSDFHPAAQNVAPLILIYVQSLAMA